MEDGAAPARSFAEQLTMHLDELQSAAPPVIAEHLVGVHAARVVSPVPIVTARTNDPTRALSVLDFDPSSPLLRVRCMRKTLHILPRPLARLAHVATRRYRVRDASRPLTVRGLTVQKREELADRARCVIEEHGPAPPVEAARQVTESLRLSDPRLATLLLKYCWEAGELFVWRAPSKWDAERRVIGADARLRAYFASLEPDDAKNRLLENYFQRFGPASIRDACWWSGLGHGVVKRHLEEMGDSYVTYAAPWSESKLYGLRGHEARADRHADVDLERERRFTFLGHEDPILKAYFETRSRYVGKADYSRLYNQIGEARPAIVVNGHIVGIWQWDRRSQVVSTTVFPQYRALRRDATAAGRAHAALLREALAQQALLV